jgi:molybdopterin molybdotransferase
MISVNQAKTLINENTNPLPPITLPITEVSGLVLAADVFAGCDIPAFAQSSMDGYAIKFEDHQQTLRIIGEMAAGTTSTFTITNVEAARIFTGAPLPQGADTVVMQEKITLTEGCITINDPNLVKGSNVRDKGAEIKTSALAIEKGSLLIPAAIGFLAGIGITEVSVFPRPRVAIILTGDELQQPGSPLNFGQVYESNSYALTAALKQAGITKIEVLEAKDELETLINVLSLALQNNDMVLLTGGVSVGDYDFVIEAASICGVQQLFHKVKQKPGKPLYFGKMQHKLVFGLPGNPSSVLSCFYHYVLPSIALLTNTVNRVQQAKATLTASYQKPSGLTHFLKGFYADGKATPLGAQESFKLSSFAQANCLICLEEEKTAFSAGDLVTVFLLPN